MTPNIMTLHVTTMYNPCTMGIMQKVVGCFGKKLNYFLHGLKWIYKPNVNIYKHVTDTTIIH
jgi:hypothetical protein